MVEVIVGVCGGEVVVGVRTAGGVMIGSDSSGTSGREEVLVGELVGNNVVAVGEG